MSVLGWGLGNWKAQYRTGLPKLSDEEASLVLLVSERFRSESQKKEVSGQDEAKKTIEALLDEVCEEDGVELEADQRSYLCRAAFLQTFGLGFLQEMLSDASLEEIALIGLGRPIFVYVRGKGWQKTDAFLDSRAFRLACQPPGPQPRQAADLAAAAPQRGPG